MADDRLDQALTAVQTPEGQAFLDTLAGPESGGRFNVRFDGSPQGAVIPDLSRHPRVAAVIPQGMPEAGRTSDAAGAYQMLSSTADAAARRLGLPGADQKQYAFDPLSQKLLAFDNAAKAYEPYGDLLSDLQSGNVDKVMGAMRSTRQWDTANPQAYAGNLARYAQTAQSGASDVPTGRVMDAPQQDPLAAFINGTLSLSGPPAQGNEMPPPAPATVRATGIGPNGDFILPQNDAQVRDPNWNARDIPNPAIAALAAAGSPTNAPVINGQGAPVTRDQLNGSAPVSPGISALAAAGSSAAPSPAVATPPMQAPGGAVPQVSAPALPPENADIQAQRAQLDQVVARKNQLLNAWGNGVPASAQTVTLFNTLTQQEQAIRSALPTVKAAEATAAAAGAAAGALPYEQPKALAGALGTNMAEVGPNGIQPSQGALATTKAEAGAKAAGEQEQTRITQAVAPRDFRGAGATSYAPPGSPISDRFVNANPADVPSNVHVDKLGGVTIENTNPSSETIGKNFEELNKMGDTADAARQTLYQASLLKDRLNAIGTSGPATESLGELSALARQSGVPKAALDAIHIPDAPTVQQANALSLELLGTILRQTFPQRVTNTDITTFKPSNPNVNMLNEASNFLIDKIVVPKSKRDIERYGAATTLPQNDTQSFKKGLFDWDQAHPYEGYVEQPSQSPVGAPVVAPANAPAQVPQGWKIEKVQ